MTLIKRLKALELSRKPINNASPLLISFKDESNRLSGFRYGNGAKILRHAGESDSDMEARAILSVMPFTGGVVILPDNGR